jgi:hypothetical protein
VKKTKLQNKQEFKADEGNSLDYTFIEASLEDRTTPFFIFKDESSKIEMEDNFRLPIGGQFQQKAKKNPQLSSKI